MTSQCRARLVEVRPRLEPTSYHSAGGILASCFSEPPSNQVPVVVRLLADLERVLDTIQPGTLGEL